ncbi:unnamed protein product, partial [Didymodactylos carnosus]
SLAVSSFRYSVDEVRLLIAVEQVFYQSRFAEILPNTWWDGVVDCFDVEESKTISNSCPEIQRHHFQCSSSELTCLLVGALGDCDPSCSNGRDELDDESDIVPLMGIACTKSADPGCVYLRKYIQTSSENNTNKVKEQCHDQYPAHSVSFSDRCDLSSEYPCFRTDVDDVFNVEVNRPCINLTQIGDEKTDCLTGLDERNRLQCSYFELSAINTIVTKYSSFIARSSRILYVMNSKTDDHKTRIFGADNSKLKTVYEIVGDSLKTRNITFENHYLPFICNRGLVVKYYTGYTICFCPPSFYGAQCEYYSDRITVATHLDLKKYRSSINEINIIKVLTTFLFEDEIIDYYEFYVNPQTQNGHNYIKKTDLFPLSSTRKIYTVEKNKSSGFYGTRCEHYDEQCQNYCAPKSICKPKYHGILTGNQRHPFCLCSISTYGPRCYFNNEHCQRKPCLNGGTCMLKPIYISKLDIYVPTTAVFKVYGANYHQEEPNYYLLYFYPNQTDINITVDLTSENHCPLVETLWHLVQTTDQSGELNDRSDFLCLCPRCYHGQICQYSTELMSFTLDSLIVKDLQNNRQVSIGIYTLIILLIFFFGLFNNFNSFLTFIRPKPRKVGVGIYLLIISIVDRCSLLLLLFKVIHIILDSSGTLFYYENFSLYSCRIVSYLLSVFTRITYWLTNFITIERLRLVLFPTSSTLKNPRRVFGLSIFVILFVFSMHIHEVMYYTTIVDYSDTSLNEERGAVRLNSEMK